MGDTFQLLRGRDGAAGRRGPGRFGRGLDHDLRDRRNAGDRGANGILHLANAIGIGVRETQAHRHPAPVDLDALNESERDDIPAVPGIGNPLQDGDDLFISRRLRGHELLRRDGNGRE